MTDGVAKVDDDESRFAFGENWRRFLDRLTDDRIVEAELSLREMLGVESLEGRTFLDVGCGSGLFSLAARRLGARVHSFDFDLDSVACARRLKQDFYPDDPLWTIEQGSILDAEFVSRLGRSAVVYSWGVLHHTGALWEGLAATTSLVGDCGLLYISIYNDQGRASLFWKSVKERYNRMPPSGRWAMVLAAGVYFYVRPALKRMAVGRMPIRKSDRPERGMSRWNDLVDWVGGYPFEVARPEEVFEFCRQRGFELCRLKTKGGGSGCNEFVFRRSP